MTDLIKQIEAKIESMAQQQCYSPSGDEIYFAHPQAFKAGAQSLMPLIEYQLVQFENVLSVFAKNMVITDQLKNDLIETYRRQLLELLTKDEK